MGGGAAEATSGKRGDREAGEPAARFEEAARTRRWFGSFRLDAFFPGLILFSLGGCSSRPETSLCSEHEHAKPTSLQRQKPPGEQDIFSCL